jgi:hypothetical protein
MRRGPGTSRCEIREHLVAFIQQRYPGSLPRLRMSLDSASRPDTGKMTSPKKTLVESI